jgi:hypothetical protein
LSGLVDERGNPLVPSGRFFVAAADGSFSAEQYADMALTRMFESAKDYPQPLKGAVLERKFEIRNILIHHIGEAMADARKRIGNKFENGQAAAARAHLPVDATDLQRSLLARMR